MQRLFQTKLLIWGMNRLAGDFLQFMFWALSLNVQVHDVVQVRLWTVTFLYPYFQRSAGTSELNLKDEWPPNSVSQCNIFLF